MDTSQVQPVEVSGWDREGQFFVEIADMGVDESSSSTVRLHHRVTSGSLVFVRMVADVNDVHQKSYPAANEAQQTDLSDFAGKCRIRLTPCRPRDLRGAR